MVHVWYTGDKPRLCWSHQWMPGLAGHQNPITKIHPKIFCTQNSCLVKKSVNFNGVKPGTVSEIKPCPNGGCPLQIKKGLVSSRMI